MNADSTVAAAFFLGIGIGLALAFTGEFVHLWNEAAHQVEAKPLCAARTSYPIANHGPYVICEGIDASGGRVLTVVVVK